MSEVDYFECDSEVENRNSHQLGEGILKSFSDTLSDNTQDILSEEGSKVYKHQINKILLKQVFDLSIDLSRRSDIVKEVNKVILVVVIKHYSHGYEAYEEDFKQMAWDVLMKRRNESNPDKQYNPSMDAYNYMYTLFRNEIGNRLRKYTREQIADIGTLLRDVSNSDSNGEIPPEVHKYVDYLASGEFKIIRIPKKDVIPLLLFLSKYDKIRGRVPEFIDNSYNPIMYNLLKKLIDE